MAVTTTLICLAPKFISRTTKIVSLSCTAYRSDFTKLTCTQTVSQNMFCLSDYDAIGFDLDHTICKYKLRQLHKLIYETLGNYLVGKCNYSKKILEISSKESLFVQKGLILDKARGNFLKLDSRYSILKASHGTRLMTEEEVKICYGPDKIWEISKGIPSRLCYETSIEEPYYVFKDYFCVSGALLCAKIVDTLDEENGGPLLYYSFWKDFLNGLLYMYERHNFITNAGEFFPALKKNPEVYLELCTPEFKEWLTNLHERKQTFLLTSSNFDSASFLAEYSLGKDWLSYFDIVLTFARKPGFFRSCRPFYNVLDGKEIAEVKSKDMKPQMVYTQGNWQDLYDLCSRMCHVKKPRLLYIGDSLVEDVFAPSCFGPCDTVAIVEEMLDKDIVETCNADCSTNAQLSSDVWGSFFATREHNHGKKTSLSLWANIISQKCKLAVPSLNEMCSLKIQDSTSSFLEDNPTSGYYPAIPESLKNLVQQNNT